MILEDLKQLESWSTRKTEVVCVNVIEETHDVKTFQFKAKPEQLFHFKPGQFIGIQLEINGVKHNRSYTIASSPTRPHLLELTIKLDPQGAVSPWLHSQVVKGSTLELRGPAGRFNNMDVGFNPQSDKLLLISAGSGITPMMSMARFYCDQASQKNIVFLNWSRSTQDIIFRRELALMDHEHQNFDLEVVCTNPGLSENWLGRRGRVNKNLLLDAVPDINQRTVFCCGPDGFMQNVKDCLAELNFNMAYYHDETFDPGGKKKAADSLKKQTVLDNANKLDPNKSTEPTGPFNVTLAKTGKTIVVETNDLLLERIEAEGVAMESACRAGNCGACQIKKISGDTVTANEMGLHTDRKAEGYILTCCSQAKSDLVLDI
jgi:glycine betaine catabolism B